MDGRWIGRDLVHSNNLYIYCGNRVDYADMLGLRIYVFVLADDMGIEFENALSNAHNFIANAKKITQNALNQELKSSKKCRNGQEYFAWLRSRGVRIQWNDKDFTGTASEFRAKINRKEFDYHIEPLNNSNSVYVFLCNLEKIKKEYDTVYVIAHSESMRGNRIPENIRVSGSFIDPPILMLKSYYDRYENVQLITCFHNNRKEKKPSITGGYILWDVINIKEISFRSPQVNYSYE